MKQIIFPFLPFFILQFACSQNNSKTREENSSEQEKVISIQDSIPLGAKKLLKAYPSFLEEYENNQIIWKDGSSMQFDDGKENKNFKELLNNPDLQDQMNFTYVVGQNYEIPKSEKDDVGRVRYDPFFKKIYGQNAEEVRNKLVRVNWLPNYINQSILVTSVNEVNLHLKAISDDLENLLRIKPQYLKYLKGMGGTFRWRTISKSKQLSPHSFGISIDINVPYSNYWQWSGVENYRNRIPMEIVEIFEKHYFIWGGKWYHYDTMHFEYRPEYFAEVD